MPRLQYALIVAIGILFFIWPVPHTIAVRYWMICFSSIFLIVLYSRQKFSFFEHPAVKKFGYILAGLTLWFYVLALFISKETAWSIRELNGQWLVSLVCFAAGLGAPFATKDKNKIFFVIFAALAVHIVYIDLSGIRIFVDADLKEASAYYFFVRSDANVTELAKILQNGGFYHALSDAGGPFGGAFFKRLPGLTEGQDKANYLTNFMLAILMVESIYRLIVKKRVLPVDNFALTCAFVVTIFSLYLEATRFGAIGFLFMLITLAILVAFTLRGSISTKKLSSIMVIAILTVGTFATINFNSDKRWDSLRENFTVAMDLENNKAWIDHTVHPYPTLSGGAQADPSNYERPAWIKAGLVMMVENPLGVGYGRSAFGHAIVDKYGYGNKGKHAHSGIIDLGVGTGFIGVFGWMAFVIGLSFFGVKNFIRYRSYYGLILFFIAGGYFFRMIFDSTIRDHMLEQFMFLAGLFLALTVREIEETKTNPL